MDKNKIRFGIKEARYAKILSKSAEGYTYGPTKRLPGSVALTLASAMNVNNVAADDLDDYASVTINNGYTGTYENTSLPEEFGEDILLDENGVENKDAIPAEFAFLVQFTGDAKNGRHVFWDVQLTQRPSISQRTKGQNFQVDTDTLNVKAIPREDTGDIKGTCYADWDVYDDFFDSVPEPSDFVAPSAAEYVTVTQTLTHAASSFTGTQTEKGEAFTATLTEAIGYSMSTVTVTMGGTDITSTAYNDETGVISIAEATGNIVITATAAQ